MMSRRVSFLTLKGMFLVTIAVGIISSSVFGVITEATVADGVFIFALRFSRGGEPPEGDKSEVLLGERERWSWEPRANAGWWEMVGITM
jgi:hypothetical protein